MKQDRFLIGILAGILLLVAAALVLFFVRQDRADYVADDTPEGVVHNFALAILGEDYQKAYGYLAEHEYKPSYEKFREAFFNRYINPGGAGLEIGEAEIQDDEAIVELFVVYGPSDPFSGNYRSSEIARLVRQDGQWKIIQMPYNFWLYEWYQPTPKPYYP